MPTLWISDGCRLFGKPLSPDDSELSEFFYYPFGAW